MTSFFLMSCTSSHKEKTTEASKQQEAIHVVDEPDSSLFNNQALDTEKSDSPLKTSENGNKTKENKIKKKANKPPEITEELILMDDRRDGYMNGDIMSQPVYMPQKIYDQFPDTLSKLAMANYMALSYYFPRAIADNFEQGTSREIISYPEQLKFRYHVFEDKSALKPYLTKDISVRRNKNGTLYTE